MLWRPDGRDSVMRRFAERNGFTDFEALQRWSVTDLEGVLARGGRLLRGRRLRSERVLGSRAMPGAEWFPGATLNYVEHMVSDGDEIAVVGRSQSREPIELDVLRAPRARAPRSGAAAGPWA